MSKGVIFTILFYVAGFTPACFAAISLSVNPVDGSNGLRFDRVSAVGTEDKKEIQIRINSPNGNRYQVFQRVLEPMVNEKGDSLNLQAITTQTLSNSNSFGTLYLQNLDHLSMGDQLLYSSSQNGTSDGFIVGYSLNQSLINAGGTFRSRLVFTVRGMGNDSSDQVTVDVFLQPSLNFKIEVKGAHNRNRVTVSSSDTSDKTADFVTISFSGNSGQEVRVYQEIETPLQNELEQALGPNVLQKDIQGNSEGLRLGGISPLGMGRSLIYSSNKSEDNIAIYFLVNPDYLQQQDAGSYSGKIKYVVDTDQGRQEFPLNIQCEIQPQFTLNITTPPGGVSFSHVTAISPPQDTEVLVTVISNLHKPYQVIQNIQTNMTNKQGKEFDSKYFTMQVAIPKDQKGHTNFTEFSSVQTGEYPVFSSDGAGSGTSFKMVYRLQGYPQMSAGDFIAPVRLSLNQK